MLAPLLTGKPSAKCRPNGQRHINVHISVKGVASLTGFTNICLGLETDILGPNSCGARPLSSVVYFLVYVTEVGGYKDETGTLRTRKSPLVHAVKGLILRSKDPVTPGHVNDAGPVLPFTV